MQNQLEPKKSKMKLVYSTVLAVVGLSMLGAVLFYFLPIPESVKVVATSTGIERCIYPIGVGYYTTNSDPGAVNTFYNREGERICATGGRGVVYSEPEGPCQQSICLPVYDGLTNAMGTDDTVVKQTNGQSVTNFDSETFCANQYAEADQAKQDYIPADTEIAEYLEVWNQLLVKEFGGDLVAQFFYISSAEIIDVPNEDIRSEKYFQVHYNVVSDWVTLQDRAGFAIKYKDEEQIAASDISNYYVDYEIDIPWEYSMAEIKNHRSGGSRLSDFITNLQSGLAMQSCKDILGIVESACPGISNKNISKHLGTVVSFSGEKNKKSNQCGYGSVNIWSKEVSCSDTPCMIN